MCSSERSRRKENASRRDYLPPPGAKTIGKTNGKPWTLAKNIGKNHGKPEMLFSYGFFLLFLFFLVTFFLLGNLPCRASRCMCRKATLVQGGAQSEENAKNEQNALGEVTKEVKIEGFSTMFHGS